MNRQRAWNVAAVCAVVANVVCIYVLTLIQHEIRALHHANRSHYENHHAPSRMHPDALRWYRETFDPTPRQPADNGDVYM